MVRFKQRYLLVRVAREGTCKGVNMGELLSALRRGMERQLGAWCVLGLRCSPRKEALCLRRTTVLESAWAAPTVCVPLNLLPE